MLKNAPVKYRKLEIRRMHRDCRRCRRRRRRRRRHLSWFWPRRRHCQVCRRASVYSFGVSVGFGFVIVFGVDVVVGIGVVV